MTKTFPGKGEISAGAKPFTLTMQQVVGKHEDISLADMVGRPPTPWVDRGLGVAGDGKFQY